MRAFCSPKPGRATKRRMRLVGAFGRGPDGLGVPVVVLDHMSGHLLDPSGHGPAVPVDRRRGGGQVGESLGVSLRDTNGVAVNP